ncbi:MAG: winged helix-turn-helix domain-containing protein [Tepidisphaeraceae bacterium]|jgi:two-component system alkaline phosphatase synthesis response regulator PhoP
MIPSAGATDAVPPGAAPAGHNPSQAKSMIVGQITVWRERYCVSIGMRTVYLPAAQFRLLLRLASHPFRTFSAQDLHDPQDSKDSGDPKKAITCKVFKLRRKLGSGARQLQTVRGVGYRLIE